MELGLAKEVVIKPTSDFTSVDRYFFVINRRVVITPAVGRSALEERDRKANGNT